MRCQKCGNEINDGNIFCNYCGQPVNNGQNGLISSAYGGSGGAEKLLNAKFIWIVVGIAAAVLIFGVIISSCSAPKNDIV